MCIFNTFKHHQKECIFQTQISIQMMKSSFISSAAQGTINWRASSNPDFIQNYFLFNFDVRLFLIIAINAVNQATYIHFLHFYGSFRSFCKQKQHFSTHSLSLPLSLSHFLPFPPWVSTSSNPGSQDRTINSTLPPT